MFRIAAAEDAMIALLKSRVRGVKTVATHEKDFDESTLLTLMPQSPFALIRFGGVTPNESERDSIGGSGMKRSEFYISVGSQSLRSKKEGQRGCYEIMDSIRELLDGQILDVGEDSLPFCFDRSSMLFSQGGLIVYGMVFSTDDN